MESDITQYFDKLNIILNDEVNSEDKTNNNPDEKICKHCNKEGTIYHDVKNGYELCKVCGLIYGKLIENTAEWRWYGSLDSKGLDPTRCGIPINPLLPKSSMGTFIGGNKYGSLQRLHSWNAMPSDERSLWHVYEDINRKTQNSDLVAKIIDESKVYYKMLSYSDKKMKGVLTRGIVRESIKAACIFVACKNNGVPRSSSEIAKMFGIQTTDVTKGLKKFIEIEMKKNLHINVSVTDSQDFIKRYCCKLNISRIHEKIALMISDRSRKMGIVNDNTPPSIAAGIIYLIVIVYKLKITKTTLRDKLSVSDVTICKCYKKLWKYRKQLFIGIKKTF